MDDEIDRLVVRIRADTRDLVEEVDKVGVKMGDVLGRGAETAGRGIENALLKAVRTGKLGFEELKNIALSVLSEIASAALKGGLASIFGGARGDFTGVITGLIGAPGRATGGPVSPGRAYMVGERGPELFVPTSSGRIDAGSSGGGGRDVRIAITINAGQAGGGDAPQALARSSRQVARAVRAAIEGAES